MTRTPEEEEKERLDRMDKLSGEMNESMEKMGTDDAPFSAERMEAYGRMAGQGRKWSFKGDGGTAVALGCLGLIGVLMAGLLAIFLLPFKFVAASIKRSMHRRRVRKMARSLGDPGADPQAFFDKVVELATMELRIPEETIRQHILYEQSPDPAAADNLDDLKERLTGGSGGRPAERIFRGIARGVIGEMQRQVDAAMALTARLEPFETGPLETRVETLGDDVVVSHRRSVAFQGRALKPLRLELGRFDVESRPDVVLQQGEFVRISVGGEELLTFRADEADQAREVASRIASALGTSVLEAGPL